MVNVVRDEQSYLVGKVSTCDNLIIITFYVC